MPPPHAINPSYDNVVEIVAASEVTAAEIAGSIPRVNGFSSEGFAAAIRRPHPHRQV